MKRFLFIVLTVLMVGGGVALAVGAAAPDPQSADDLSAYEGKEIVEIREKMFLGQINDIFMNTDDYIGKVIKLQGMFDEMKNEENGVTYYFVYRNSPGCCGADGRAAFEFVWDQPQPTVNDWIEVTGVLEYYDENGVQYMHLTNVSLQVLAERGQEFVTQ